MDKKCSRCKCFKDTNEFHKNRARKDGIDNTCKQCWKDIRQEEGVKEYRRKYKERNKEKIADYFKKNKIKYKMKRYKASLVEYENALNNQENACAICKTSNKRLVIDHCHSTNKFRGLLCKECNLLIGFANDDIITLINAINYLKKYKHGPSGNLKEVKRENNDENKNDTDCRY